MIHYFKPQNFVEALELWLVFPDYHFQDLFKMNPIAIEESAIQKISASKLLNGKLKYFIDFSNAKYDGFLTVSQLPESLIGWTVHTQKIFNWKRTKPLLLGFYKNSLTVAYILFSMLIMGLVIAIQPIRNPTVLLLGVFIVAPIFTFLYYRWRRPRIRHLLLLSVIKWEALSLAFIICMLLIQMGSLFIQKQNTARSNIEMSSQTK